jgi:hypothetical protein
MKGGIVEFLDDDVRECSPGFLRIQKAQKEKDWLAGTD